MFKLVTNTLDRYMELGGSLDFISEYDMDEYNAFLDEVKAC